MVTPLVLGYIAAGTAVAGAATAGYQAYEAHEAKSDAADAEAASTAEQARVMDEENKRREASARARSAASGVDGLSSDIYLKSLEEAGTADMNWLKRVGSSRYNSALATGNSAYSQALSGAFGSLGTAAKSIASIPK